MNNEVRNPRMGAAMTFAQIGRETGMSESLAQQVYWQAIQKLKRNCPHALALLNLYRGDLADARGQRTQGV